MGQTFSIPFTAGAVGVLLSFAGQLNAGQPVPAFHTAPKEVVLRETPWDRGRHEFQAMAGTFFSVDHSPDRNYRAAALQLRAARRSIRSLPADRSRRTLL